MLHQELTEKIIGAAFAVYNSMGFGFLESVYETCPLIELCEAGLKVRSEAPIRVRYKNQLVGAFLADLLVEDRIQSIL